MLFPGIDQKDRQHTVSLRVQNGDMILAPPGFNAAGEDFRLLRSAHEEICRRSARFRMKW